MSSSPFLHVSKSVGKPYREEMLARQERRRKKVAGAPRKPYFNPSAEQVAASTGRREAQAAYKSGKQFRRVAVPGYRLAEHIHPGQVYNAAISGAAAIGAGALIHHDRKLAKGDHVKRDTAAGAVAGGAAVDVASVVGGQGAKAVLKERRVARGQSPHEARVWAEHKQSHGVRGRAGGSIPNSTKLKVYRSYPKELPDWRAQRALAIKNNPKVAVAGLAAGALGGAALAHHMSKASRAHKEEAGAAVVGAGAGQGAYQQAGYATKHRVDRLTRKGNPGVSAAQVKLQDKTLKANKSRFGMHLPKDAPGRDNVGYHRAYPSELPHARTIRALGHTHEGKLGVLIGATATVGAGAAALGAAHHHLKKAAMTENPFLPHSVAKYSPGTITLHHEQAQMHARKKASASRGIAYGVGAAGLGAGAFLGAQNIGTKVREVGGSARAAADATRYARHGGAGLAIGGVTLAGGSLVRRVHHARKQNVETKRAQTARMERNRSLAKSAFDVEHEIDKSAASIIESGIGALKGVKAGLSGTPGVARGMSEAHGVTAGAAMRSTAVSGVGKLKPLGGFVKANPGKTALIGGAGIGVGRIGNGH